MYRIYCLIFVSLVFTNCKDSDEKSKKKEVKSKSQFFTVDLEFKINNKKDFIMYYKDGSNEWFVDDKAIWQTANGSKDYQKVTFVFPENVIPIDYRLDIGRNELTTKDSLYVKSLTFKHDGRELNINSDIYTFNFAPNEFIAPTPECFLFQTNKEGLYDGYFSTTNVFYNNYIKTFVR